MRRRAQAEKCHSYPRANKNLKRKGVNWMLKNVKKERRSSAASAMLSSVRDLQWWILFWQGSVADRATHTHTYTQENDLRKSSLTRMKALKSTSWCTRNSTRDYIHERGDEKGSNPRLSASVRDIIQKASAAYGREYASYRVTLFFVFVLMGVQ
jgi:hypothetical protein